MKYISFNGAIPRKGWKSDYIGGDAGKKSRFNGAIPRKGWK